MKRVPHFASVLVLCFFLFGCFARPASSKVSSRIDYSDFFTKYLTTDNKAASISSSDIKALKKDMTYGEIIKTLGATKDIGSGVHVAVYTVDNNQELLLSFVEPKDVCSSTGEELLKKLRPLSSGPCQGPAANVLIASPKFQSVPVFDWESGKQVGEAYKGFAISIDSQEEGKAFFTLGLSDEADPNKAVSKKFFIPLNFMEKGYIEPFAVIEIISSDRIVLREKAPIYDRNGNEKLKFNERIGALHYIQNTPQGFQFVIGFNLCYVKEKDVEVIKHVN